MGVFHLGILLTVKSCLEGWHSSVAVLSGPYHTCVAIQAHRSLHSRESWVKALSCFAGHTASNLHNVLSVHNCCDMGDMSMCYLCKQNHMSKNSCLRIVSQAIHQELWEGMKLSLFNIKVEAKSLKVKRYNVLRQWELNKYLFLTPPLKILSYTEGNKNVFCAISFSK